VNLAVRLGITTTRLRSAQDAKIATLAKQLRESRTTFDHRRKKMKIYRVSVDIKYTDEYMLGAKSAAEAKRKAIDKFRGSRKNFQADVEDVMWE
jgi:hypothetical protein